MSNLNYCFILFSFLSNLPIHGFGQSFHSYFTGNPTDAQTTPQGGVCLMGGASENDNAIAWFLQKADGGDVLVLRASGSDGYNNYFYTTLGVNLNSVETIVFNSPAASFDPYIHQKIQQAEAIWFAGGDQWDYISYWRGTPVDSLINEAIAQRNIAIGGTSAGMAILGKYYFSAKNGTISSAAALANPYATNVTVDSAKFLHIPTLTDVITDTHYDNPDRRGRHATFLARILTDYGVAAKGIACDEYTAVCIDTAGIARVFGDYPAYDDNAYFIQTNCELTDPTPETCTSGSSLTWSRGGQALKIYRIKGNANGTSFFNLKDWKTGNGGDWLDWSINNGVFVGQASVAPNCTPLGVAETTDALQLTVFPNPASSFIQITAENLDLEGSTAFLLNAAGQVCRIQTWTQQDGESRMDIRGLKSGVYLLLFILKDEKVYTRKVVVKEEQ